MFDLQPLCHFKVLLKYSTCPHLFPLFFLGWPPLESHFFPHGPPPNPTSPPYLIKNERSLTRFKLHGVACVGGGICERVILSQRVKFNLTPRQFPRGLALPLAFTLGFAAKTKSSYAQNPAATQASHRELGSFGASHVIRSSPIIGKCS